jgi:Transposase DDE domain
MAWALWQDDQHRAAQMHVAFEVLRQIPVGVTVTAGNASERAEWRGLVQPGGCYVVARGYTDSALFQELHDLPCSFIARVQHNAAYEIQEARPVSASAGRGGAAGLHDPALGHGPPHPAAAAAIPRSAGRPSAAAHGRCGGSAGLGHQSVGHGGGVGGVGVSVSLGGGAVLPLVEVCAGLPSPAQSVCQGGAPPGLCGHHRQSADRAVGGAPPSKRTYEMLCFYLSGWASEAEVIAHIDRLHVLSPLSTSRQTVSRTVLTTRWVGVPLEAITRLVNSIS